MGNYPPQVDHSRDQLRQVEVNQDQLNRLEAGEQVIVSPTRRIEVGNEGEVIVVNISNEGILPEEGGVKARILKKDTEGALDGTFLLEKVE